jgi:dTDP-glucose pyrophosphorylase
MLRLLLISGDALRSETTLRRRILKFTGSRRATRVILRRVENARQVGRVVSLMVSPTRANARDADDWDVSVSYAGSLTARRAS